MKTIIAVIILWTLCLLPHAFAQDGWTTTTLTMSFDPEEGAVTSSYPNYVKAVATDLVESLGLTLERTTQDGTEGTVFRPTACKDDFYGQKCTNVPVGRWYSLNGSSIKIVIKTKVGYDDFIIYPNALTKQHTVLSRHR
jgi:hypothetical protein